MTTDVSKYDDIIDSRDVVRRIEELTDERAALAEAMESAVTVADLGTAQSALADWDEENSADLAALKALQDQAEGYADDWNHGATLIRDSYFEKYAQEFADDIGAIDRNASWPLTCIDWEKAATELQQDYTSVEFDGVTYWVR